MYENKVADRCDNPFDRSSFRVTSESGFANLITFAASRIKK
jgi:hypothetical protein